MRTVYFSLAGALGIMGLILAFENIMIQSNGMMIFFEVMTGSIFFPLIFILLIGFLSGLFTGLGIKTKPKRDDDFTDVDI